MYVTLSKLDIASAQLEQAISLYLDGSDLISSVTLAGAADEILGKLAKELGKETALDEKAQLLCKLHKAVFKEEPSAKAYIEIKNNARNAFKHFSDGKSVELDLERAAWSMIERAIANYRKVKPGYSRRFGEFEKEMVRRHRETYGVA